MQRVFVAIDAAIDACSGGSFWSAAQLEGLDRYWARVAAKCGRSDGEDGGSVVGGYCVRVAAERSRAIIACSQRVVVYSSLIAVILLALIAVCVCCN